MGGAREGRDLSGAHGDATGVVQRLYAAFQAKDGAAMQACYAPDATFRDPVFTLDGAERIGGMWQMLLERGDDLTLEVSGISEDGATGIAHWEADYTFTATGRHVHNVIDAAFILREGRIVTHVDHFDFWRWSRQALGPLGVALGWSPVVRTKVRGTAARSLDAYLAKRG